MLNFLVAEHQRHHDADRGEHQRHADHRQPELSPFRAENFDLSVEWYFAEAAWCRWRCSRRTCPTSRRPSRAPRTLQDVLDAGPVHGDCSQTQTPQQRAWILGGGPTARRASTRPPVPGRAGRRDQGLRDQPTSRTSTFLPGFLKNFGVQANYTKLTSDLQYIVDPGQQHAHDAVIPQVTAAGPFLGRLAEVGELHAVLRDPEVERARFVGVSRRLRHRTYPVAAGSLRAGTDPGPERHPCDAPLVNDFIGSKATRNIDA